MPIEPDQIRRVIDEHDFSMVFQPIYSLARGTVIGLEALTRFTTTSLGPAPWFAAAHAAGLGVELELATARHALAEGNRLPARMCLWVNLSLSAMLDPRVHEMLVSDRPSALGVEITGQDLPAGDDADAQRHDACRCLQREGVRLSLDAAAYRRATRSKVARLSPDQVKADLTVTETLETSRHNRWQARRIAVASHRRGATLVAEGVETPAQLQRWARLGADAVQGFLLAPPAALSEALASAPISPTVEFSERRLSIARDQ